jgi:hypothetical protein
MHAGMYAGVCDVLWDGDCGISLAADGRAAAAGVVVLMLLLYPGEAVASSYTSCATPTSCRAVSLAVLKRASTSDGRA